MSTENPNALVAPEPFEQSQLSPKIQTILIRHALDYHSRHRDHLPPFTKKGLEIAAEIVHQAFIDGVQFGEGLPEKSQDIELALKKGLEMRKVLLARAQTTLNGVWAKTSDLGISTEEVNRAREEYNERERRAHFPETYSLLNKVDTRTVILAKLAEILITPVAERMGITGSDRIRSYIPDPALQSKVVRGFVFAALGRVVGIPVDDPTFITDEELNSIASRVTEKDPSHHLPEIARALSSHLSTPFDREDITNAFEDYGKQVVDLMKKWENTKRVKNLEEDVVKYWENKNSMLATLPITPFTPGIQYATKAEQIGDAIAWGHPHLWEEGREMEGEIIPSLSRIRNTLRLYKQQGVPITNPNTTNLLTAYRTLESHESRERFLLSTITRHEERIQELSEYLEANRHILQVPTENDAKLAKDAHTHRRNLLRFAQVRKKLDESYTLLTNLESLVANGREPDLLRARLLLLENKVKASIAFKNFLIAKAESALEKPSWRNIFNANFEEPYTHLERVYPELELVKKYLNELRSHPKQAMPRDFYANPQKLREFIIKESKSILRSLSSGSLHRDTLTHIDDMVNHASKYDFTWIGFRDSVIKSLNHGYIQLGRLSTLLEQRQKSQAELKLVTQSLENGQVDPNIAGQYSAITIHDIHQFIGETRAAIVPLEVIQTVTPESIEQARTIESKYRLLLRNKQNPLLPKLRKSQATSEGITRTIESLSSELQNTQVDTYKINIQETLDFLRAFLGLVNNPLYSQDSMKNKTIDQTISFLRGRGDAVETYLYEASEKIKLSQVLEQRAIVAHKKAWYDKQKQVGSHQKAINSTRMELTQLDKNTLQTMRSLGLALKKHSYERIIKGESVAPTELVEPIVEEPLPEPITTPEVTIYEQAEPLENEADEPDESIKETMRRFANAVAEELARQIITAYHETIKRRKSDKRAEFSLPNPIEYFQEYQDAMRHLAAISQNSQPKREIGVQVRKASYWLLTAKTTDQQRKKLFTDFVAFQDPVAAQIFTQDVIITRGQKLHSDLQEFLARISR